MVVGTISMIAGFVATVKAAEKTSNEEPLPKDAPVTDKAVQAVKTYGIPSAFFITSIAAFILANRVSLKQAAALAGAYESLQLYLRRTQDVTEAEVGERKSAFLKAAVSKAYVDDTPPGMTNVTDTGHGDTLFYDILSKQYFLSSVDRILAAEKSIRSKTRSGKFVPFNVFLWLCDVKLMKDGAGDEIGWNPGDKDEVVIGFEPQVLNNGARCLVLAYRVHPHYAYLNPASSRMKSRS